MGSSVDSTRDYGRIKVLLEKLGVSIQDWAGSMPGESSGLLQKDIETTIEMLETDGLAVYHSIDDLAAKIIGE